MGSKKELIGKTIGSYRLLRFLGEGGFGEVYYAEHVYLGTPVAVKILSLRGDQQLRDLIRAEARTSARLRHPHIIPIIDFGFEEEMPYLVMMYAAHGTLRTLHPRTNLVSPPRVAWYVRHIAQALFYAHERKIIHRDVKPENMLLDAENRLYLSDFGIAVAAHRTASLNTMPAMGTSAYMAPEQARGKARVGSDQYALAICVYEWLTGSLPFVGASALETALLHQQEPLPDLETTNPRLYKYSRAAIQEVLLPRFERLKEMQRSTIH